jgi:hypothetical protein
VEPILGERQALEERVVVALRVRLVETTLERMEPRTPEEVAVEHRIKMQAEQAEALEALESSFSSMQTH